MHEPVELIDDDLDIVAGGTGGFDVDVNIADVDQRITQFQFGGFGNRQAAANVSQVDQN